MTYFSLELWGENLRVEWNGQATFNIQDFIAGKWVDVDCFTQYDVRSEFEAKEVATDWILTNLMELRA
tara:strand:- start:1004 stop:1207 length:204 start_codon:yes stop_codon:yes gene_type:complete